MQGAGNREYAYVLGRARGFPRTAVDLVITLCGRPGSAREASVTGAAGGDATRDVGTGSLDVVSRTADLLWVIKRALASYECYR